MSMIDYQAQSKIAIKIPDPKNAKEIYLRILELQYHYEDTTDEIRSLTMKCPNFELKDDYFLFNWFEWNHEVSHQVFNVSGKYKYISEISEYLPIFNKYKILFIGKKGKDLIFEDFIYNLGSYLSDNYHNIKNTNHVYYIPDQHNNCSDYDNFKLHNQIDFHSNPKYTLEHEILDTNVNLETFYCSTILRLKPQGEYIITNFKANLIKNLLSRYSHYLTFDMIKFLEKYYWEHISKKPRDYIFQTIRNHEK